jgi:hypothetical protein
VNNDKDFKKAWTGRQSKAQWRKFLNFSFGNGTRKPAYARISKIVGGEHGLNFLEIGFGQCYDFNQCFKGLHDSGNIRYSGIDITEQFANYASEEFPGYNFKCGGFLDVSPKSHDIIFTANTLEHQHPETYEQSLRSMLDGARKMCVIIWFQQPREKWYMHWAAKDGFDGTGAWVNRYDIDHVKKIISECGLTLEIDQVDENRSIYYCTRSK